MSDRRRGSQGVWGARFAPILTFAGTILVAIALLLFLVTPSVVAIAIGTLFATFGLIFIFTGLAISAEKRKCHMRMRRQR